MAKKVTEVVIDDLDGSNASETVQFTIGGKSYEIDPRRLPPSGLARRLCGSRSRP